MTLQPFREEMARLGRHPDKDIIVKLTNMALQQKHRATDIVDIISNACLSGSLKDRERVLKLLRLWRERSVFQASTLDPIDRFIDAIEKGTSTGVSDSRRGRSGGGSSHLPTSSQSGSRYAAAGGVGDKRKAPSSSYRGGVGEYDNHHQAAKRPSYHRSPPDSSRSPPRQQPSTSGGAAPAARGGGPYSPPHLPASRPSHIDPYAPPPDLYPSTHRPASQSAPAPAPPPATVPAPTAAAKPKPPAKTLEFIVAVEKEMRTMLASMVHELGETKGLTIEELARRNPSAAEQLKNAAEASVTTKLAQAKMQEALAAGPFEIPPKGKELLNRAGEVAERLNQMVTDAAPTHIRPGLINAAKATSNQLLAMVNVMKSHQGLPLFGAALPPPMPLLQQPPPVRPPPPQQQQQQQQQQHFHPQQHQHQQQPPLPNATQLALQALAQQLAGAFLVPNAAVARGLGGGLSPPSQQQQHIQQQQQQQQQQAPAQVAYPVAGAGGGGMPVVGGGGSDINRAMVSRLYTGEQCSIDGQRLPSKEALRAHEAWLDQIKTSREEAKHAGGLQSREWFVPAAVWIKENRPAQRAIVPRVKRAKGGGKGGKAKGGKGEAVVSGSTSNDGNEDEEDVRCVPMDDAHSTCKLCGERFDQFWDAATSQWMYRNAVRVLIVEGRLLSMEPGSTTPPKDSKMAVVHWLCFKGSDHKQAAKLLLDRRDSGPQPTLEQQEGGGT